ncbi:MAG: helix-turn-helix domain-containing protein (plasmid) [Nodularia sp. CChRGM 3473]
MTNDTLSDNRRKRHIYMDSKLDDLPLTMEAYRVYCHLCRRAGCDNNAFPSYKSIGEACFHGSFPNSPPDSLRRKAIAAVNELIYWNLITKTCRAKDGFQTSNHYSLTDLEDWFPTPSQPSSLIRGKKDSSGAGGTPRSAGGTPGVVLGEHPRGAGGTPGVVLGEHPGSVGGTPKDYPIEDYPSEVYPLKNAPPKPGAPPTHECVCEEKTSLKEKPNQEQEPIPQSFASLSIKPESSSQTDKPSCGAILAGSFDKREQTNKGATKKKFQSIEDLLNQVLLDPGIMASDPLPAVYKSEIKLRGWRFPWRTDTRDKIYQTCDRRLVELIARERAKWSGCEWTEKIPTVIKSIGNLESSKGGLEELLGYWSKVLESDLSPTQETQQRDEPIGYYSNRSLDWHKATFSELLDLADEVGIESAIAKFSTRYDQQHKNATIGWLNWLKIHYPQMYAYLHQPAA